MRKQVTGCGWRVCGIDDGAADFADPGARGGRCVRPTSSTVRPRARPSIWWNLPPITGSDARVTGISTANRRLQRNGQQRRGRRHRWLS